MAASRWKTVVVLKSVVLPWDWLAHSSPFLWGWPAPFPWSWLDRSSPSHGAGSSAHPFLRGHVVHSCPFPWSWLSCSSHHTSLGIGGVGQLGPTPAGAQFDGPLRLTTWLWQHTLDISVERLVTSLPRAVAFQSDSSSHWHDSFDLGKFQQRPFPLA